MGNAHHPASFRDPSGFVYFEDGQPFRYVSKSYAPHYRRLIDSGLYQELVAVGKLLPHRELDPAITLYPGAWKILAPELLHQWSYACEWSFYQLKDAALLTLDLNLAALKHGMILKDAAASNIQFRNGAPLLIDTLSFEKYEEGWPWQAFRQFCQHFLYPLMLMRRIKSAHPEWLMAYPDGIPAATAKELLPRKSRLSLFSYLYLGLPAKKNPDASKEQSGKLPAAAVRNNLMHLRRTISTWKPALEDSHWSDYYTTTILSDSYLAHKVEVIECWFRSEAPGVVTDIGCNTGVFSLLAGRYATAVVALDNDAQSVGNLYRHVQARKIGNVYPMVASISNPTPALGWNNAERNPLLQRIEADTVLALALVHHLCLSENVTLPMVFRLLAELTRSHLIVEFIPKEDPMAQRLLSHREDVFALYDQENFEAAAAPHFNLIQKTQLRGSSRTLYFYRRIQ